MPASRDRALLIGGLAAFAGGAVVARQRGVTQIEQRCFELVNGLSHRGYPLVWLPMQLGNLAGPLVVGAVLRATGHRRLGARVAAVGTVTWVAAKALKPVGRRGRPAHTVPATRVLGQAQAGLGYPSGHAAVAAATAAVVAPHLTRRARPVAWAVALAVGPMRGYVGAHLPLDVFGGVALGVALGAAAGPGDVGGCSRAERPSGQRARHGLRVAIWRGSTSSTARPTGDAAR
ncbi:MAG TPA: phosphatase PAP2 family protein [Acidimicrobiales bacterium]|nr:phosphatase PAP2 family protein [Acidimicrobiales bacterium]